METVASAFKPAQHPKNDYRMQLMYLESVRNLSFILVIN